MFGTTFCQMENSLLMTLTALLLLGVREGTGEGTSENKTTNFSTPNSSIPQAFTITNPTVQQKPCPETIHNITQLVLARLKVTWKKGSTCEGRLSLDSPNQRQALCHSSYIPDSWWSELCKDMRCGEYKGFKSTSMADGLLLTSDMMLTKIKCSGLHIICEDSLGSELAAYKAVTGILIFLMLGVILLQFSRPTYKAIRKRFSQKRQNRWIGPTQSQSVSYHRGQGAPNNNTLKRQSFPGLERLTVNTSREPSSNRNSDYDSYGYN